MEVPVTTTVQAVIILLHFFMYISLQTNTQPGQLFAQTVKSPLLQILFNRREDLDARGGNIVNAVYC